METLRFDLSKAGAPFKTLNATNGGPWHRRHAGDQFRSNLASYKAAHIPYSRNHDSAACTIYGGPYSHDISCIFPNFDADADDPNSYDFACTDESILVCLEANTETFFRLGQTIEHQIKKHGTLPPKDFQKWAVICEHIIRHYNEGWADGFHLNIQYWEIWNEPDLDPDDAANKRTWGGTEAQFFDFYEVAATHLKKCFPNVKIGGPALTYDENWAQRFLNRMKEKNVPIDFFSWHIYSTDPSPIMERAVRLRSMLDKSGYSHAESILDEWNYVKGWAEDFLPSVKTIHSVKDAAFMLACMCEAQQAPIDMLMYYDTRPSVFNGVFDYYTYEELPGYYALYWYGQFYEMQKEICAENNIDGIYSLCGVDDDNHVLAVLAYYSDDDDAPDKTVRMDLGKDGRYEVYLLDGEHRGQYAGAIDDPVFDMKVNSAVLIRETVD